MGSTHYKNYLGKRKGFEASKQTPTYKKWRAEQWKCQNGRCAWCYDKIELYSDKTVADHINPLYNTGDNDFNNLVLSCWECNKKKGKETGWEKPDWIKENRYATKNYDAPSPEIDNPNPYIASRNVWLEREEKTDGPKPMEVKKETFKEKIEYFLMDFGVYSVGDFIALIILILFVGFPIVYMILMLLAWFLGIGR